MNEIAFKKILNKELKSKNLSLSYKQSTEIYNVIFNKMFSLIVDGDSITISKIGRFKPEFRRLRNIVDNKPIGTLCLRFKSSVPMKEGLKKIYKEQNK